MFQPVVLLNQLAVMILFTLLLYNTTEIQHASCSFFAKTPLLKGRKDSEGTFSVFEPGCHMILPV